MKTLLLVILVLVTESSTMAAQGSDSTPTPKPSPAVCKADLKMWSADKTETLSIACGDEAKKTKKKDKEVMKYLYEFYRTHAELGNRTLDFIKRHDLSTQFREEENGVSAAESTEKH